MRINHRNSYFCNIVSFTLGVVCSEAAICICFTKEVLFEMLKKLQKTTFVGVFFNKVRLATLIKRGSSKGIFQWIFRNYYGHLFYKTPPGGCFVDWNNPHDCWSKVSFFSPLKFLILIDSALMDLVMECRNFILQFFTKQRRNLLELPRILSLLSMIYVFHVRYRFFVSFWPRMK